MANPVNKKVRKKTTEEGSILGLAGEVVKIAFEKHILPVVASRSEYGDSFQRRRIIYFTDRMASKCLRIRMLEDLMMRGIPPKNEGIAAELRDIVVYGLFALDAIDQLGDMPFTPLVNEMQSPDFEKAVRDWAYNYFGIKE